MPYLIRPGGLHRIPAPLLIAALMMLLSVGVAHAAETVASPDEQGAVVGAGGQVDVQQSALPGAAPYPVDLQRRISQHMPFRPGHRPDTHFWSAEGVPRYANRLILEHSPYLLDHAHNPVNWYPWGKEALATAKRENKLIFLSIGYSSCHWCHVMEQKVFEDLGIATYLNQHFINIKVDRERRPDLDQIYMTAVQVSGGRGGWPLSVFLIPEGDLILGGTYIPPARFTQIMEMMVDKWGRQEGALRAQADEITRAVAAENAGPELQVSLDSDIALRAVKSIMARHDPLWGGFGRAPKFPSEVEQLLLLQEALRSGDRSLVQAVEVTLQQMARGGIFDQIGGGFHRYATDARWQVPHFEKMLYNQAQIARVYLAAYQLTGKPLYERIARATLDFMLRDMADGSGLFYSAFDADSEGQEGTYYLWTPAQIKKVLSPEDAALAIDLWGVTEQGNFEGKNILHLATPLAHYAKTTGVELPRLLTRLEQIKTRLEAARRQRVAPSVDQKIITAWNGLALTALSEAATVLGDAHYRKMALKAAKALWADLRKDDNSLWRSKLQNARTGTGGLNDYAYLAEGLLSLSLATDEPVWMARADTLVTQMQQRFNDPTVGGFFMTDASEPGPMILRPKQADEGALPSGNAVAVRVLAMLNERSATHRYRALARQTVDFFSARLSRYPGSTPYLVAAWQRLQQGPVGPTAAGTSGAYLLNASIQSVGAGLREVTIDMSLAKGWHINAHQPLSENLVPTTIAVDDQRWQVGAVQYPQAEEVRLEFSDEPLALYQGQLQFRVPIRWQGTDDMPLTLPLTLPLALPVTIQVQACDELRCMLPESHTLQVPLTAISSAGG